MVEAYKKFILVSLLFEGTVPSISRFSGHGFIRQVKQNCSAYEDLATAFSSQSPDEVRKIMIVNSDIFLRDSNLGLVKQVLTSLTKSNITKLTKTYLTLSLKNIAEKVHIQDEKIVEQKILEMIRKGEIYAQINQKDGMISFHENPDQFRSSSTMTYLDFNIYNTINLCKSVRTLDETITTSPQYMQKAVQSERGRGFGGPPGGSEYEGFTDDPGMGFRG